MKTRACIAISVALSVSACGGTAGAPAPAAVTAGKHGAQVSVATGSTVAFPGNRASYTIARTGSGFTVTDNAAGGGTVSLTAAQRLQFADTNVAFDVNGAAGSAYRIYQAAFARTPDAAGLGYWIDVLDRGAAVRDAAAGFLTTAEFKTKYGAAPANAALVASFYTNVLGRVSDAGGYAYWLDMLDTRKLGVAEVLAFFADGDENKAALLPLLQAGFSYTPMARIAVNAVTPGAPVIGAATAGNGSASFTFTAPASNGGAAITGYTASCSAGAATRTGSAAASPVSVTGLPTGTAYRCSITATTAVGSGAAAAARAVTPAAAAGSITGHLFCPYSASVYNAGLNLTSTVAVTCSTSMRTMSANGVPDHSTGAFPNSGNPNAIKAVTVNFSATLNPAIASTTGTAVAHVVGYANNGVKFDPATAESYQNAGVWKIEALNQSYFPFGVDASNAHVQPDGGYHYHGVPEGYVSRLGKGAAMTLLGFAVDGFPIYARYGYTTASDAHSAVKVLTPSYRMKSSPSAGRPSTSSVPMGTFTQDYEYVAGLGDLDECNGRTGVTPEFPNGIYHYVVTDGYPYISRCVKGSAPAGGPP